MLSRAEVIQELLNLFPQPSYLEVGVNRGETFHAVTAAYKVAVDPQFMFDFANEVGSSIEYHQVPSDDYFGRIVTSGQKFDVIYLDGLHTAEQTLRDLLNSLHFISPNGVIVLDDTIPNSFDASLPDFAQVAQLRERSTRFSAGWQQDGSWMGDVYKDVFFILSFMQQWSYATVQENHGQTVAWQRRRDQNDVGSHSLMQVSALDYRDTLLQRERFNILPIKEIVEQIAHSRTIV